MTLQQLKYFDVMSRVLHYTEASKQLYISQPSLSHALGELEKELEVPLFEKQGKRTILTAYGIDFQQYTRQALLSIEMGVNHLKQMQQPTSIIQLGYIYSLSFDFLPKIVSEFCNKPDNIGISFNFFQDLNERLLDKLRKGDLHFALSVNPQSNDFFSLPVYTQKLYLAVPKSHRFASRETVLISELRDEKLVALSPNSSLRSFTDHIFKQAGFMPKIVFEAEECNAMASFVGNEFGLAIMPHIPSMDAYHVSLVTISDCKLSRDIYLIWSSQVLPDPVLRFKEFVLSNYPTTN